MSPAPAETNMPTPPSPRLSLLIPTRERVESLRYTLATALDQRSAGYEVIVSDNDSADGTRAMVTGIPDPRLKYINPGRRLSMCDNYEYALDHAAGDFVLIIGDDDAVMPGGLDRLLAAIQAQPDQRVFTWPVSIYEWPKGGQPAHVTFLAPIGPPAELDLKLKAKSVVEAGGWKHYELPSPYHSAVARVVLDAIRTQTGRVFHSTQPDVFTQMAIPAGADRALNLGQRVTIHGRSPKSNGWDFVNRSDNSNLQRFIGEYGDYQYHPRLYRDVAPTAKMIPDAILKAMDFFPTLYGSLQFDDAAMWAYLCRLDFCTTSEIIQKRAHIIRHQPFSFARFLMYSAVQRAAALRRRFLDTRMDLGPFKQQTPDNIRDFVQILASQPPGSPSEAGAGG